MRERCYFFSFKFLLLQPIFLKFFKKHYIKNFMHNYLKLLIYPNHIQPSPISQDYSFNKVHFSECVIHYPLKRMTCRKGMSRTKQMNSSKVCCDALRKPTDPSPPLPSPPLPTPPTPPIGLSLSA